MMRRVVRYLTSVVALCAAVTPLYAQDTGRPSEDQPSQPGAGLELWFSTDSDKTEVVKLLGRALWHFEGRDEFQGIAIERARFRPQGQRARDHDRFYLDLADDFDGGWRWRTRVGTDGHTVLGSASLRAADWSKEFFVEREIVETPQGIDKGIYYTFLGASVDFPGGKRDLFNAMVGIQEFTGNNVRLHGRGSYVHLIKPEMGLSAQLRGRFFHSTAPGEFDYYSPRNFAQLLPVVQMRRFDRGGWMYLVALGWGAQKATGARWQDARLADVRIESPANSRDLQAFGQLQYSNNSLNGGAGNYNYGLTRVGLSLKFR